MTRAHHRGFTLVELVMVLSLLSLSAVILVPAVQPQRAHRLDAAAGEVADAIRFARSESLRTGEPHGFVTLAAQNRLRVFRADVGTIPPTPVFDVYHPVSHFLYDLDLDDQSPLAGVTLAAGATWLAACTAPTFIAFDSTGTPHCGDPMTTLLEEGTLTLSLAGQSRDVVLAGETGRVVVQ